MKKKVSMLIVAMALVVGSLGAGLAGTPIGEFSWQMEPWDEVLRLQVTDMGNGHYLLNGVQEHPEGYYQLIGTGDAEIRNDGIAMSVIMVGTREVNCNDHIQALLDPVTLSGPFMDLHLSESGAFITEGTLNLITKDVSVDGKPMHTPR